MRSRWLLSGLAVVFLTLLTLNSIAHPLEGVSVKVSRNQARAETKSVTHLALFGFKQSTTASKETEATLKMMQLREKCIHPVLKTPYIKSIRGGKNISPQDLNAGTTHAFVVEFESVEHRDYWINNDQAHKDFRTYLRPLLETPPIAVDFEDGVFF